MEVDSEAEVEAWEVAVDMEVAMEEVVPVEIAVVPVEVAMVAWLELAVAVALKQVDVDVRMGRSVARAESAVAVEGLVLATVQCPLLDPGAEGMSKRPITST